jgi:hypothetical protein
MTEGRTNDRIVERSTIGSCSSPYPAVSAGGKLRQTVSILYMPLAKSPFESSTTSFSNEALLGLNGGC